MGGGKVGEGEGMGKRGGVYDMHEELEAWQGRCIMGVMSCIRWGLKISALGCEYCASIWAQRNSYTAVGYLETCAFPFNHVHDFFGVLPLLKLFVLLPCGVGVDARSFASFLPSFPISVRKSNHSCRTPLRSNSCHVHQT